jgi:hypothetical protein
VDNIESPADERKRLNQRRAQWFAEFRCQPLRKYIAGCYGCYWDLQNCQPKSPLFWFVWMVKGHDDMIPYLENPKGALEVVESHLTRWSEKRKRKGKLPRFGIAADDPWREWFDIVGASARAEFYDTWQKIRYRPGTDPLHQAFVANQMLRLLVRPDTRKKRPLEPPEKRSTQDYEFFIGLAGHLQVAMGLRNILLPCEAVGELMDIDKGTVSRYRRWAIEDGYLREIRKHKFKPGGGGRATEFRIDASQWDKLKERMTTEDLVREYGD